MANIITGLRFVCGMILLFMPTFSTTFYVMYIIGCVSDMIDGVIARLLKKTTELGKRLDSTADYFFFIAVFVKLILSGYVYLWVWIWGICIAAVKGLNVILGIVLQRKFVAEHTFLSKLTGFLLFLFPLYVGRIHWSLCVVFISISGAFASLAAVQEMVLIIKGRIKKELKTVK